MTSAPILHYILIFFQDDKVVLSTTALRDAKVLSMFWIKIDNPRLVLAESYISYDLCDLRFSRVLGFELI